MALNKRIIRTLLDNKSRYIGAILLIALSSMVFVSFSICGISIKDSVNEFREKNNIEDVNFTVNKEIPNESNIESKFNIKLEKQFNYDYEYKNGSLVRILSKMDEINKHSIVSGKDLNRANDIIVNKQYAEKHGIKIGENIKIKGSNMKVVGFFTTPEYLYILKSENDLFPDFKGFGIGIIKKSSFNKLTDYKIDYHIKFNENTGKDSLNLMKKYLHENYIITKWVDREDNARIITFNGDIMAFIRMGEILPIILLIMSCSFVAVVIWRMLKEEFVLIGILYALGYKKKEILSHYIKYSIIISLLGSIIGSGIGILLIKPLENIQSFQYNLPIINYEYDYLKIATSILLPFIIIVSVTIMVLLKALKMSPISLMKGGEDKVKVSFFERKLKLGAFNFDNKFKIRELVRNPARTLLTIFGVCFSAMLLLFGFVTNDSINQFVDSGYKDSYKYKYMYMFKDIQNESSLSRGINKIEGDKISTWPFSTKKVDKINVYAVQEDSKMIALKDKNGKNIKFDNIIITKTLADKLNLKKNKIILIENKITSKKVNIKIDEIAINPIGDTIFIPLKLYNEKFDLPKESFTGILTNEKQNFDLNNLSLYLKKTDYVSGIKDMMKPMKYLLLILGLISSGIGIIIIYVVTSMLIEENRINISLLKIIGYEKGKIFKLVLNSNTIIVITAYIIAIPLIVITTDAFFSIVTSEMKISMEANLKYINIVIGFLILFIIYQFSKILVRHKVINISMVEVLKSKNE